MIELVFTMVGNVVIKTKTDKDRVVKVMTNIAEGNDQVFQYVDGARFIAARHVMAVECTYKEVT